MVQLQSFWFSPNLQQCKYFLRYCLSGLFDVYLQQITFSVRYCGSYVLPFSGFLLISTLQFMIFECGGLIWFCSDWFWLFESKQHRKCLPFSISTFILVCGGTCPIPKTLKITYSTGWRTGDRFYRSARCKLTIFEYFLQCKLLKCAKARLTEQALVSRFCYFKRFSSSHSERVRSAPPMNL